MNGCYNRAPFEETVDTLAVEPVPTPVGGGWFYTAMAVERSWPNRFAQDCQYRKTDLGKADPGCVGCKWREE